MSEQQLVTAEQLWQTALPKRSELIYGKVVEMTPTGREHGRVTTKVSWKLAEHVEKHDLGEVNAGETGFRLRRDPDLVHAADVSFVAKEHIPADMDKSRYWEVPPDLAVEIVSPNDTKKDILDKVQDYIETGTRLIWLIDPERRTVTVYRAPDNFKILHEDDWLDGADVVPNFRCQVKELL